MSRNRASSAASPPPDDVQALGPDADHEAVARKILLDQLTGQARSRSELAGKLAKKGVPDEVADRLLDRFEEVGLVDDAAYADMVVRSRHATRGLARRAIAHELRAKGVDDEVVQEALAGELDPAQEETTARALVERRLRTTRGLDRDKRVARLAGMLARKGYPSGLALRAFVHYIRADFPAALADCMSALRDASGDANAEARTRGVLAMVHWSLGNYEEAMRNGDLSLAKQADWKHVVQAGPGSRVGS